MPFPWCLLLIIMPLVSGGLLSASMTVERLCRHAPRTLLVFGSACGLIAAVAIVHADPGSVWFDVLLPVCALLAGIVLPAADQLGQPVPVQLDDHDDHGPDHGPDDDDDPSPPHDPGPPVTWEHFDEIRRSWERTPVPA